MDDRVEKPFNLDGAKNVQGAFDPRVNLVPFQDIELRFLKRMRWFFRGTPIEDVRSQIFHERRKK